MTLKFFVCLVLLIVAVDATAIVENVRVCSSTLDGHLLLADKNAIWSSDAGGERRTQLFNHSSGSISLDYDILQNVVYWCNTRTREILSLDVTSSSSKVAIPKQKNWLPVSVAVDPLGGRIYVAEGFSDTVQAFGIIDKENSSRAMDGPYIVIGSNVNEIGKIVVDPYRGYLFVLDRYQIIRTDLDGEDYRLVYSETGSTYDIVNELPSFFRNIFDYSIQRNVGDTQTYKKSLNVADIALDLEERRIYWVNSAKQIVESSDYDGKNKRTHFEDKRGFKVEEISGALALIDEFLYWANPIAEKVIKIDAYNSSNSQDIIRSTKVSSMKGISCSVHRTIKNPCVESRCEHSCLRSGNEKKFRCVCNLGYELAKDGTSCVPVEKFILYTHNQYIRGRIVDAKGNGNSSGGLIDVLNPTKFEVGSRTAIEYDAGDDVLFYSSLYPKNKLHQLQLDTGEETVMQPDLLSRDVGRFAYDWTTRNIYFFSHYYADANILCVTNARNPSHVKIIVDHVDGLIRDFVAHPRRAYLFYATYIEDSYKGRITRIGMDGSGSLVIMSSSVLDSLDGLALDYEEERIYWSQSQRMSMNNGWRSTIRHSKLDGSSAEDLVLPEGFGRPDWLAVSGNHLYLVTNGDKLVRMNKITGKGLTSLVSSEIPGQISGLRIFSRELQADGDRPCASLDCDKLCLTKPDSKRRSKSAKCACPYGEKLDANGKSCIDNRDEEPHLMPCEFESFKCNRRTAAV